MSEGKTWTSYLLLFTTAPVSYDYGTAIATAEVVPTREDQRGDVLRVLVYRNSERGWRDRETQVGRNASGLYTSMYEWRDAVAMTEASDD